MLRNLCLIKKPLAEIIIKQRLDETFSKELRDPFLESFDHAKTYKEFSTSQKQAVTKLPE